MWEVKGAGDEGEGRIAYTGSNKDLDKEARKFWVEKLNVEMFLWGEHSFGCSFSTGLAGWKPPALTWLAQELLRSGPSQLPFVPI